MTFGCMLMPLMLVQHLFVRNFGDIWKGLMVRDRLKFTQALIVDPLYLQHHEQDRAIDYRHWGIPLSRRFRSLKLWFVIRMYGVSGLQKYVREHARLAKRFEQLVKVDPRFEVVNDVILGLVCFRMKAPNGVNRRLLKSLNASGTIHMVPALVDDKFTIRFCVCAEKATDRDIVKAWEIIQEKGAQVLGLHQFASMTLKIANGTLLHQDEKDMPDISDDEDETIDAFEAKKDPVKALAAQQKRKSYFVRMVSDPKRYNPKPVRTDRGASLSPEFEKKEPDLNTFRRLSVGTAATEQTGLQSPI